MKKVSISKSVRDELAAVQARIGEIESELETFDDERFRLQSAPVSRAEAMALIDDELNRLTREGQARISACIRSAGRGNRPDLYRMFEKQTSQGRETDTQVLITILSTAIRETAEKMINSSDAFSDDSFTAEQRAKRLTEVDAKIEKLEGERSSLIEELRSAGFAITDEVEADNQEATA